MPQLARSQRSRPQPQPSVRKPGGAGGAWRAGSELRAARKALAESERRYRSLFEAALDCIMVIAPDGTLRDINAVGCRSLGYTADELRDGAFTRILDDTGLRRILPGAAGREGGAGPLRAEQEVRAKDGGSRAMEYAASPLRDGNLLVVVRDVTERKQGELRVRELNSSLEQRVAERTAALESANRELEAANHELESFGYSVSHDLRAPLRAIAGFSAILRRKHAAELPADAARMIDRVEANALRMADLIGDLLEFSRTGRAPLVRSAVDMRALVDGVLRDLLPAADGRTQIDTGELPAASGDEPMLRQVWANLIGNALKFSRRASAPRLEISARRVADMVEYQVRDNGAGFDMTYVERLFGVFQRLHGPDEFEGTGVGLAIVQRIVRRHGGEVFAEGAPGQGATFRFSLPAA